MRVALSYRYMGIDFRLSLDEENVEDRLIAFLQKFIKEGLSRLAYAVLGLNPKDEIQLSVFNQFKQNQITPAQFMEKIHPFLTSDLKDALSPEAS